MRFSSFTRLDEVLAAKGCIKTRVKHPIAGWIDIYNSHLGAVSYDQKNKIYNSVQSHIRLQQNNELIDWLRKTRSSEKLIITVDLNLHYKKYNDGTYHDELSEGYKFLTEADPHGLGLVDTYLAKNGMTEPAHWTINSNNPYVAKGFFGKNPDAVTDYIFISSSKSFRPYTSYLVFNDSTEKENSFISDHYGIISEISLQ